MHSGELKKQKQKAGNKSKKPRENNKIQYKPGWDEEQKQQRQWRKEQNRTGDKQTTNEGTHVDEQWVQSASEVGIS